MEFAKHSIILGVIDSLLRQGSRAGKTHIQKAISLLRDTSGIPVPFTFVLYKHGPYSFEVETELEQMRSYGAIRVEPNAEGFGVTLHPDTMKDLVWKVAPLGGNTKAAIDRVCGFVGTRNVSELERLATASWIRFQEHRKGAGEVAERLNSLKPHISKTDARRAYAEVSRFVEGRG